MKKITNISQALCIMLLLAPGLRTMAQDPAVIRSGKNETRVAILPMTYMSDERHSGMDEMGYRLQNISYLFLRAGSMILKFQDPGMTNALLLKNGIHESNLRQFTPAELADLLHVEYVVMGIVTQEIVGTSTRYHSRRVEDHYRRGRYDHGSSRHGHSHTREQYNTYIDLSVYNDHGELLYSRSRKSILSTPDAYRYGIEYLLKRSPLYKK